MSLVFYKKVTIQNQNLYPAVTKIGLIEFKKKLNITVFVSNT